MKNSECIGVKEEKKVKKLLRDYHIYWQSKAIQSSMYIIDFVLYTYKTFVFVIKKFKIKKK